MVERIGIATVDICNQASLKGLSLQRVLIAWAITNPFVVRGAGPNSLYVFSLCV